MNPQIKLSPEVQEKIARIRAAKLAQLNPASNVSMGSGIIGLRTHSIPPDSLILARNEENQRKLQEVRLAESLKKNNSIGFDLNPMQLKAISYALNRTSFCLTGAAGTGKTTTTKAIVLELLARSQIGKLATATRNHHAGTLGIFFLAFTRAAVRNLRKNVPKEFADNCITIHKFVEMAPEDETFINSSGETITRMVYKPRKNSLYPFPSGITTLIFDESSMIGEEHYKWIKDAIPYHFQEIFLGDINQLPTVADFSIFPNKLTTIPVIELNQIYRQAETSSIIPFAHSIKNGEPPTNKCIINSPETYKNDQLFIGRYPKEINDPTIACMFACNIMKDLYKKGKYDPLVDLILCPWKKHFGVWEINKHIATFLDEEANARGAPNKIHEIIAGYETTYLAVNDKVFYDKEPAIITEINNNPLYSGNAYKPASINMTRWGLIKSGQINPNQHQTLEEAEKDFDSLFDLDEFLHNEFDENNITRQASHVIRIKFEDNTELSLNTTGEINSLELGYSTTIHKSQGSQWPRVFILLHACHNKSLNREMLYTAITRAEKSVFILCEKDTIEKRSKTQAIKGDTLEEKINWYRDKIRQRDEERNNKTNKRIQ